MFHHALKTYAASDYLTDDAGENVTIFGIGAVAVVGILSLLFGFLLAIQRAVALAYFRSETLPQRSSADLILAGELPIGGRAGHLLDSREATVIAPISATSARRPGGRSGDRRSISGGAHGIRPEKPQPPS